MDNLNNQIIAQIYAKAVFELADECNCCEKIKDEIADLAALLAEQKDFVDFLDSPFIQINDKTACAAKIFSGRIDKLTEGLLASIIRRKRIRLIGDIAKAFEALMDERGGVEIITVTLAQQPSEDEYNNLCSRLEEAAAAKVKVRCDIDPSILGGIIISQDQRYIDNSLRRILYDAKSRIKNRIKA